MCCVVIYLNKTVQNQENLQLFFSLLIVRAGRSGGRIRTRPDWPWGPPSLLYNEYQVIAVGKAAGAWR